jgi:hypothetical protein
MVSAGAANQEVPPGALRKTKLPEELRKRVSAGVFLRL